MYDIKYKTRNNADYHNMAKIYFSCHHDDHNQFFETISNDILQQCDCAVFYDENPLSEYDKEEYCHLLSTASIIVVPVTEKFLSQPNRSRDFDVKFALEHHIPLLPVMVQGGLVQRFNTTVGQLQFLDRTATDSTALAYKEKLKRYMDSILPGTGLVSKINKAFNGHIFLSYRKKDRVFANRLMQLIHSHRLCRDVAIWYDEFLTPGEMFENNILSRLEKCDLFALAVTPNVLEKGNYVQEVEYKEAKKLKKDIMAVQLQPTDTAQFMADFSGCPAPLCAENDNAINTRLEQFAASLGISQPDNSPVQCYLMGCAYLGGINVEKNIPLAVQLITDAAKNNFVPAMEKLVQMYLRGDGVVTSLNTAALWQEKIVDLLEDNYDDQPAEDKAFALVVEMNRLCQLLDSCMQHSKVLERTEDMEYYCCQYIGSSDRDIYWKEVLHAALYKTAAAYMQDRQLDMALKFFANDLNLLHEMYENGHNLRYLQYIAITQYQLSLIYTTLGQQDKAAQCLAVYQKNCAAFDNRNNYISSRVNDIALNNRKIRMLAGQGDVRSATALAQQNLLLAQQFYKETDSDASRISLCSALTEKATLCSRLKDNAAAIDLLLQAEQLMSHLAQKADNFSAEFELANIYSNLAVCGHKNAVEYMDKAVQLLEKLNEKTNSQSVVQKLIFVYGNAVFCYALNNRKDKFDQCILKAFELVAAVTPNVKQLAQMDIQILNRNMDLGLKMLKEKNAGM